VHGQFRAVRDRDRAHDRKPEAEPAVALPVLTPDPLVPQSLERLE